MIMVELSLPPALCDLSRTGAECAIHTSSKFATFISLSSRAAQLGVDAQVSGCIVNVPVSEAKQ
jgi:hypothetical protein